MLPEPNAKMPVPGTFRPEVSRSLPWRLGDRLARVQRASAAVGSALTSRSGAVTIRAVDRRPLHALVAALLLLCWQAPAMAALSLGLHLADEHGGHHAAKLELALAATHGHHHDSVVTPHDHSAVRIAVAAVPVPAVASCSVEPAAPPPVSSPATGSQGPPAPTGSPPLFASHCALLL